MYVVCAGLLTGRGEGGMCTAVPNLDNLLKAWGILIKILVDALSQGQKLYQKKIKSGAKPLSILIYRSTQYQPPDPGVEWVLRAKR